MNKPVRKPVQTAVKKKSNDKLWRFDGKDRASGKGVNGEISAVNEAEARQKLARRGVHVTKVQRQQAKRGRKIKDADVTLFSRQLATMMKAGLPLLQAFEIAAKGQANSSMMKLLMDVRGDVEQGMSLGNAFAKHPAQFDQLFCSLVNAGEAGGVLDSLLDKLATYKEKTQAIRKKVKKALTYPVIVLIVAFLLIVAMMVFVLPAFKDMYDGVGATLPWITQFVMDISDFFVAWWWVILIIVFGGGFGLSYAVKHSWSLQQKRDRLLLQLPIFGPIVRKSVVARWARTTATLFTAGVPLVEALNSVAGAAGNILYEKATRKIQQDIKNGISLTTSMTATNLFPNMMVQMASIGEESGSLDDMLNKVAEFLEDEVDQAVDMLSTMMEPIIMVFLGVVVGGLLVAMYLPLFQMGDALKG
ncbi:type II secretion system F family protein [Neisseria sp. Ec49-e6-T10]|uniref:type II secretion system F family protein n=1 Tax=Neisseria sp. Ec49-e6-T10 TaxID=3140744 RepID=UPI003EB76C3D